MILRARQKTKLFQVTLAWGSLLWSFQCLGHELPLARRNYLATDGNPKSLCQASSATRSKISQPSAAEVFFYRLLGRYSPEESPLGCPSILSTGSFPNTFGGGHPKDPEWLGVDPGRTELSLSRKIPREGVGCSGASLLFNQAERDAAKTIGAGVFVGSKELEADQNHLCLPLLLFSRLSFSDIPFLVAGSRLSVPLRSEIKFHLSAFNSKTPTDFQLTLPKSS